MKKQLLIILVFITNLAFTQTIQKLGKNEYLKDFDVQITSTIKGLDETFLMNNKELTLDSVKALIKFDLEGFEVIQKSLYHYCDNVYKECLNEVKTPSKAAYITLIKLQSKLYKLR